MTHLPLTPQQQAARASFNQRSRHTAHRLACLQGYRAKANLVTCGKGRNSLAGVPSVYLEGQEA